MATDRWAPGSDAGYGSRSDERSLQVRRGPDRPWRDAGGSTDSWREDASIEGRPAASWATYEGGHNRGRAARDFGSGLGFGTGYGGQRDYDPGEHAAGPFLGGMYYGGGDVPRGREERAADARSGGAHRGRGPKGYARTDERLFEDVCERMTDDPMLDASDIEVHVSSGEVSLDGTVADRAAKHRAERVAESVHGVGHVQNNLRVRQPASVQETMSGASSGRAERPDRSGPQGTGLGGVEVGPQGSDAARGDRGRRQVGASR